MSEFVQECRREWRRLGVPDPVANEMAADLTADLEEAAAEGASPEDVLGNSAFDPRRFAAAWATARGVTGAPVAVRSTWRPPVVLVLTVLLGLLTLGAGFVLLTGSSSRSFAISRHIAAVPRSIRLFPPGVGRITVPGPVGRFVGLGIGGVNVHPLGWTLLTVGVVGLGVLAVLYWSLWSGHRRRHRPWSQRPQNWD